MRRAAVSQRSDASGGVGAFVPSFVRRGLFEVQASLISAASRGNPSLPLEASSQSD